MRIIIPAILIVGAFIGAIPVEAASTQSSSSQVMCSSIYTIVAGAAIGAGDINFCVYHPEMVLPGSVFSVNSVMTAPPTVIPVFLAAGAAFAPNNGCTEGTPVMGVPTTNGVVGTIVSYQTTFTMTGEQCDFTASISLIVGAVPLQVYSTAISVNVRTENMRLDNFNYLCDAPGIAPNAYSVTTTTCNDPNLALTGTITCIDCSDTVNVGNTTVNVNVNATGNGTTVGGSGGTVFEPSLYVLMIFIALVLIHAGERNGRIGYFIFSAILFLVAGFVSFWEQAKIGFDEVPHLIMPMAILTIFIAGYLIYRAMNIEQEETKNG